MNARVPRTLNGAGILLACVLLAGCVELLVGGAIVSSVVITQDRRSVGGVIDDSVIEFKISDAIAQNSTLRDKVHVSATSVNGIVLVTGETPTRAMRGEVLEIARATGKVRQVVNEIRIAPPASLGTRTDDSLTTSKIKSKLYKDTGITDATRINVHTANSVVYLMGLVTRAEAATATEIARNTGGVSRVVRVFEYVD